MKSGLFDMDDISMIGPIYFEHAVTTGVYNMITCKVTCGDVAALFVSMIVGLFGDCDGIIYLTGAVTFIDFEYADVNYSAYDIGNYFCEFSGNFLFTCCICFNTMGLKHCFGN